MLHSLRIRSLPAALAALVLLSAPALAEDVTIVSKVTAKKGASTTSTQYLSADKLRVSDGEFDTITDVSSGKMIHVEHKKKRYYETSLEEMRQQFAEMERMLDENPMMAKMLGQATEVEVEKAPGGGTYAGYDCENYVMTIGEKMRFELCAAPGLEAPTEYYDARKLLYAAMGPMASRFEKMFEEMKKIDGFPLYSRMESRMMGFDLETTSEATEVKIGPIPADVFEPPAGYKQKKSPHAKK